MRQQVAMQRSLLTRYGQHDFSVFRIGPAHHLYCLEKPFCWTEDDDEKTVCSLPVGTILFPRYDEKTYKLRHHVYEEGIFDAIRGRAQTMLGYGAREGVHGERQKIEAARSTLRDVWALLASYSNLEPEERRRIKDAMRRTSAKIGRVRNGEKVAARRMVESGRLLRDSSDRLNPSATRVRFINARERLGLRLEEIAAITPAVGYYEVVLLNEVARVYSIFEDVWRVLTVLVGSKGTLRTRKHFDPRLIDAIIAQLSRCATELDTINELPFIYRAQSVERWIKQAIFPLKDRRLSDAYMQIVFARKILACVFALRELERIRFRLSCAIVSGKVDRRKTSEEIRAFLARMTKKTDICSAKSRDRVINRLAKAGSSLGVEDVDLEEVKNNLRFASAVLAGLK